MELGRQCMLEVQVKQTTYKYGHEHLHGIKIKSCPELRSKATRKCEMSSLVQFPENYYSGISTLYVGK